MPEHTYIRYLHRISPLVRTWSLAILSVKHFSFALNGQIESNTFHHTLL